MLCNKKTKLDKPLTMAQGGDKPSYFVPERVGKKIMKQKTKATQKHNFVLMASGANIIKIAEI